MVRINYITPYFWLPSKTNRSRYLVLARYRRFTSRFVLPLLALCLPLSSFGIREPLRLEITWGGHPPSTSSHKKHSSLNSHHIARGFLILVSSKDGISGPMLDCHSKNNLSASKGILCSFSFWPLSLLLLPHISLRRLIAFPR